MTTRCKDTNFYAQGEKVLSGAAWVIDPTTHLRLRVVSGRTPLGTSSIHVASLPSGVRLYREGGPTVLLDAARLYGHRGRTQAPLTPEQRARADSLSHQLSKLLRHGAIAAGLEMDPAGWAARADVIAILGCTSADLDIAILNNNKSRFEAFATRIRAVQGHSPTGTPVALEALELSWRPVTPSSLLYHATRAAAINDIAKTGLLPRRRSHVHLAYTPDLVAATSGRGEALIVVDPTLLTVNKINMFEAPNGVVLVRAVPPSAIKEVVLKTSLA